MYSSQFWDKVFLIFKISITFWIHSGQTLGHINMYLTSYKKRKCLSHKSVTTKKIYFQCTCKATIADIELQLQVYHRRHQASIAKSKSRLLRRYEVEVEVAVATAITKSKSRLLRR